MSDTLTRRLVDEGDIPNNPDLPLIVRRGAATPDEDAIRTLFQAHGWGGAWVNGIYDFHHYHSTAHEVLGIARGEVEVQFGGRRGPVLRVATGDVVFIPAGVGHCLVGGGGGLSVVGAYPEGQDWDLRREGDPDREGVRQAVRAVPLPRRDPVTGLPWGEFFDSLPG